MTRDFFARLGDGLASLLVPPGAGAAVATEDVELTSKRTPSAKVFERPDKTRYAEVATGPIHYLDESSQWKEIDSSLVRESERYRNRANSFRVSIARDSVAADLVSISQGDVAFSFGLPGASGLASASDNIASFTNVMDGVSLEIFSHNLGLKETLILERPRTDFLFALQLKGLKATLNAQGDVTFIDKTGGERFRMPKGWMQDSAKLENGEGNLSEGVAYELIGIPDSPTGLLIRLDEEWLKSPERVFPVRVDPSVDVETPSDDTFVQESIQNTRQDSNTELKAGCGQTTDCTPGSGTNDVLARTLLHFNLPGEVSGNQVTLAELKIYEFHSWSCSAEWVHVVDVTSGWTGAVTWPGQPSYGGELATLLAAKGYSGSCPAGWLNFIDSRLTAEVDGWSRYGQPNNGLSVQSFNEASELGWKKFRSYQYGSNRPTMHIDYNRQPTAPTLSGVNDNDTLRTFTPTLSASSTDPDGNPLQYQFHIMLNGADVHVSPWTSNNYVVPMGILRDGGRYNWYAVAKDTGPWESAPSSTRGFKLDVLRLGVRSYYPTDSHSLGNGTAASINLASGNLIVEQTDVNLPTASAPFSFVRTYNSKASGKGVQVYLDDDDGRPFPTNWEAGEDGWVWVTDKFWSGSKSHKSPLGVAGLHQHYFYGGQEKTFIPKGSSLGPISGWTPMTARLRLAK